MFSSSTSAKTWEMAGTGGASGSLQYKRRYKSGICKYPPGSSRNCETTAHRSCCSSAQRVSSDFHLRPLSVERRQAVYQLSPGRRGCQQPSCFPTKPASSSPMPAAEYHARLTSFVTRRWSNGFAMNAEKIEAEIVELVIHDKQGITAYCRPHSARVNARHCDRRFLQFRPYLVSAKAPLCAFKKSRLKASAAFSFCPAACIAHSEMIMDHCGVRHRSSRILEQREGFFEIAAAIIHPAERSLNWGTGDFRNMAASAFARSRLSGSDL